MPTNITTDGRCSPTAHSCNENGWVSTTSAFFKGAFFFRIHADVCTSLCRRITKDIQDTTMFAIADHCVLMRQINLSWCWDVSNDGLAALVQNVPSLLLLNCTGIKRLTDTPFLSAAELMPDLRVSMLLHFLYRCIDLRRPSFFSALPFFFFFFLLFFIFFCIIPFSFSATNRSSFILTKVFVAKSANNISDELLERLCEEMPSDLVAINYYGDKIGDDADAAWGSNSTGRFKVGRWILDY